jgi:hypothetical protein
MGLGFGRNCCVGGSFGWVVSSLRIHPVTYGATPSDNVSLEQVQLYQSAQEGNFVLCIFSLVLVVWVFEVGFG